MDEGRDRLSQRMRIPLALLLGTIAVGVIGYMTLEGWSFLDALYMTVITFTTVGFREVQALGATGQIFTMLLLIASVVLALVTISIAAQWWTSDPGRRAYGRRRMQTRIDRMSDHFILCAYGRVGRSIARELEAAGVSLVVVDPNPQVEERMQEDGVTYLIEDPTEEPVLRSLGIDRARAIVVAVDSDATNVYITLTARSLNPSLFIVARASEPDSEKRLRAAGADRVVSLVASAGRHIALVAVTPQATDVLDLEPPPGPALQVDEFRIESGSSAIGRELADALPELPALAIRHADGTVTPNPDPSIVLGAGDLVLTLGREEAGRIRRA